MKQGRSERENSMKEESIREERKLNREKKLACLDVFITAVSFHSGP